MRNKPVDIVAHRAGGFAERGVGHQQRPRRIIAKADGEQPVRAGDGQARLCHHIGDHRLPLQHHELVREHEFAAFGG